MELVAEQDSVRLSKGPKKTELGFIPFDWEVKKIGEFAHLTAGGTPSTLRRDYWGGNIRWMNSGELNLKIVNEVEGRITEVGLKNSSTKIVPKYCVLIGLAGQGKTRGTAAYNTIELCTNQSIAAIYPSDYHVPQYLYYNIDIRYQELRKLSTGDSGRGGLNLSILRNIQVAFPPTIAEQQAIVKALGDVDALISNLDKLITKKKAIKQGAMQNLLNGKTRLPSFKCSDEYKKTEVGLIPINWDVKKIGEFTHLTAGGTPNTQVSQYWGGDIKWMSSGELNYKIVNDVEGRITEFGLKNSSTKVIPKHCVLIGLAGQGRTRGTAAVNTVELCTNQSIAAIFPSNSHDSKFLYYNLDNRYEELRKLSTGDSGRGGLNLSILRAVKLAFPPLQEQKAIATIFSDMDAEIENLEKKKSKYQSIKQGMMQELLTGKTRLV